MCTPTPSYDYSAYRSSVAALAIPTDKMHEMIEQNRTVKWNVGVPETIDGIPHIVRTYVRTHLSLRHSKTENLFY